MAGRDQRVDVCGNLGHKVKPICQKRKCGHASCHATLVHFGLRHLLALDSGGRTANQRNELGAGVGGNFTGRGGWYNRRRRGRGNLRR